jgi:hypothetical protein
MAYLGNQGSLTHMKQAAIFSFVLALVGAGFFLLGVARGVGSFEMAGFILTLPLTLIAVIGLAAVGTGLVARAAMAAWSALALPWASEQHRRTRG